MSTGAAAKLRANATKGKVYLRKDADAVLNSLPSNSVLSNKNRGKFANEIWALLNDAPGSKERNAAVHDIALRITEAAKSDLKALQAEIAVYEQGLGKIWLSEDDVNELKLLRKGKSFDRIIERWRSPDNTGMTVSEYISRMSESSDKVKALAELSNAEALSKLETLYTVAKNKISKAAPVSNPRDFFDGDLWSHHTNKMEHVILEAFDSYGRQSQASKIAEISSKKAVQKVEKKTQKMVESAVKKVDSANERAKEQNKKLRARHEQELSDLKARQRESNKRVRESRARTAKKHSAMRSISRLTVRLLHPTKTKNILQGMQSLVFEALSHINLNTEALDSLAKVESELAKLTREDVRNEQKQEIATTSNDERLTTRSVEVNDNLFDNSISQNTEKKQYF